MLYKQIGIRLRQRRKELNMTQEIAAEKADISFSFYGHIERGTRKLSMETFYKILKVLDCSADDILGTGTAAKKTASALELLMLAEELSAALEDDPEEVDPDNINMLHFM